MSTISNSPRIKEIADIIGDAAPHSMSEFYGINFSSGTAAPTSGAISLSGFRNQTVQLQRVYQSQYLEQYQRYSSATGETWVWGTVDIAGYDKTYIVTGNDFDSSSYPVGILHFSSTGAIQTRTKLTPSVSGGKYGSSVAINGDGTTAVIGAPAQDSDVGAIYVFVRNGNSWTQQARLTPGSGHNPANSGVVYFGYDIAISLDGNTIAVLSPGERNSIGNETGCAYVFTRSNGLWTQEARLQDPNWNSSRKIIDLNSVYFGSFRPFKNITISGDKNTIAFLKMTGYSEVEVFTKGTSWSSYTVNVLNSSYISGINVTDWWSIDSNYDGTMLITSSRYNTNNVVLHTKANNSWSYTNLSSVFSSSNPTYSFGSSCCISSNGTEILVSDYGDQNNGNWGVVYRLENINGTWTITHIENGTVPNDIRTSSAYIGSQIYATTDLSYYISVTNFSSNAIHGFYY